MRPTAVLVLAAAAAVSYAQEDETFLEKRAGARFFVTEEKRGGARAMNGNYVPGIYEDKRGGARAFTGGLKRFVAPSVWEDEEEKRGGARAFQAEDKRGGGRLFYDEKRGGARYFHEKKGGGRAFVETRGGARAAMRADKRGGARMFVNDKRDYDPESLWDFDPRSYEMLKRAGGRAFRVDTGEENEVPAKRGGGRSFPVHNSKET